jgi:hypothetical protein
MRTIHKKIFKTHLILRPLFLFCILQIACKKQIEVGAPDTSINSVNVYSSDATAAAVLTGIYTQISNQGVGEDINGISVYAGLSCDELTLYDLNNLGYLPYYKNNLSAIGSGGGFWVSIYSLIFDANAAIEGLNSSTGLTPGVKQQLLGEAKFMRAFFYFYLADLYGNVALVTSTDYKANAVLSRTAKTQILQQIIIDLRDAQNLLSANYLDANLLNTTTERVRPTKWAADALLARAYLFTGAYDSAETEATLVINNNSLYSLDSLNGVFLKNNTEAIWQLQPVQVDVHSNTWDGALLVLPSTGPDADNFPIYLSNNVVNSFEPSDLRRINWVDSVVANSITYYYPYKYKIGLVNTSPQEYIMMLRLGEQYLIRAEARAQQSKITDAQSDLNSIRSRAGLPITSAGDQASLMTAILHERKVELFTEWGNRLFDLQRFGLIDSVMNSVAPEKGATWSSYKALYPILLNEIKTDHNLVQTPGY